MKCNGGGGGSLRTRIGCFHGGKRGLSFVTHSAGECRGDACGSGVGGSLKLGVTRGFNKGFSLGNRIGCGLGEGKGVSSVCRRRCLANNGRCSTSTGRKGSGKQSIGSDLVKR